MYSTCKVKKTNISCSAYIMHINGSFCSSLILSCQTIRTIDANPTTLLLVYWNLSTPQSGWTNREKVEEWPSTHKWDLMSWHILSFSGEECMAARVEDFCCLVRPCASKDERNQHPESWQFWRNSFSITRSLGNIFGQHRWRMMKILALQLVWESSETWMTLVLQVFHQVLFPWWISWLLWFVHWFCFLRNIGCCQLQLTYQVLRSLDHFCTLPAARNVGVPRQSLWERRRTFWTAYLSGLHPEHILYILYIYYILYIIYKITVYI